MRVLLVTAVIPPRESPEADYARVTAEDLAARGYEVHVLTGRRRFADISGVTIHPVVPDWSWRGLPAVAGAVRRLRPDIVVLLYLGFLYERHPMATMIPALVRLLRRRTAIVTMVSDPVAGAIPRRRWRLSCRTARFLGPWAPHPEWGLIAAGSDRLTTTSWSRARDLERMLPGLTTPIDVYPAPVLVPVTPEPAVARREERSLLGIRDDEVVLIFFGYLYSGKGLETLLEALALLRGRNLRPRLMVAGGIAELVGGDVYNAERRRQSEALDLEDQVIWLGGFDGRADQASRWLTAADLAVFSPGMGIQVHNTSVGTAAIHGLPILATAGAGTEPEIFIDGDNVRLVAPQDPQALALGLEELFLDGPLRRRLGEGARRLAERWYTRDRAAQNLEETLRAALAARRNRKERLRKGSAAGGRRL